MIDVWYAISVLVIFAGPFAWVLVAGFSDWLQKNRASARFKKALAQEGKA